MRTERRRDNQQWILDWMVKTTGRVQNFANDERELPAEVSLAACSIRARLGPASLRSRRPDPTA